MRHAASSGKCGIGSSSYSSPSPTRDGRRSFAKSLVGRSNASHPWEKSETLMGEHRLIYTSLSDATPESELDTIAAVYAFVLESHERRKAADQTGDRNEVK